jgi:rSAM/selenodomain-associated transferase 1
MMVHQAILLEAPRPGVVKPRLAGEIGELHALRLYRILAGRALDALSATGFPTVVWYTPPEARSEMARWLGPGWELRAQASGDYGARLAAAARAVPPGHQWLCIRDNCLGLSAATLREAVAVLERTPVVLGPTLDGGYYLIGGHTPLPDLFSHQPWGTPLLLRGTRERLIELGVPWEELLPLKAIDTMHDAKVAGLLT